MPRTHVLEAIPAQLWRLVKLARHRVLMFDYDGTLAPFRVERQEARPTPGAVDLLRKIGAAGGTTVAIITGRPLSEVERLLDGLAATYIGEHGWERRMPDGSLVQRPLSAQATEALDSAERSARALGFGELLERKRTSVVLHTRSLSAEIAVSAQESCAAVWRALAAGEKVIVDHIVGGIEVRAWGCNKGTAALSLLSQAPPGSIGVYVGDDATDEDAFDAVREWGFGIRVGERNGPTQAMGSLTSCESVPVFLNEWLMLTCSDDLAAEC